MKYSVLGVGYASQEYVAERAEWMEHDIVSDFANTTEQAAEKLRKGKKLGFSTGYWVRGNEKLPPVVPSVW